MFIENKYTKIYYSIINTALNSDRVKNRSRCNGIYERHHIIPKSLGGTNDKSNKVLLTPREHFICHRLLTKMTLGDDRRKMIYAMWNLTHAGSDNRRESLNSRTYNSIREEYIIVASSYRHSDEVKEKIKAKNKATYQNKELIESLSGKNNPMFTGYFITPWGKFESATLAAKACPYGWESRKILTICKTGMLKHHDRARVISKIKEFPPIPNSWLVTSYKDLGFAFEPV